MRAKNALIVVPNKREPIDNTKEVEAFRQMGGRILHMVRDKDTRREGFY